MLRNFCYTLLLVALTACGGGEDATESAVTDPLTDPVVIPSDITPDAFNLGETSTASPLTSVESSSIMLTGFDTVTGVSIEGGEYSIDGADYVSSQGMLAPNQTIQVRLISSAILSETTESILTVGGVSDTFSVTAADLTEPMLKVLYPAVESLTDEASTLLRGTVSDELSDVASLTLHDQNSNALIVTQNAGEWAANVDLEFGINTFTFEAQDTAGNILTKDVVVQRRKLPILPRDVFPDTASNRVYYIDSATKEFLKVDMTTEAVTVITDMNTWETDFRLTPSPTAIQIDIANDIAYILDRSNQVVWAYNLITDEFDVVVELKDLVARARWEDLVIDTEAKFLYVLHNGGIVKVDMQNKTAEEFFSNLSERASELEIHQRLQYIEYAQGQVYVSTSTTRFFGTTPLGAVIVLDEDGSNLKILSTNEQDGLPSLYAINGLAIDKKNQRLLLSGALSFAENFDPVIYAVDIVTGVRSVVTRDSLSLLDFYHRPTNIVFDSVSDKLFSTSISSGDIQSQDLVSLETDSLNRHRVSTGNSIRFSNSIAVNNNNIFLFDIFARELRSVNTLTGERTTLVTPNKNILPNAISQSTIDIANNRVFFTYIVDPELNQVNSALAQIDISTGELTVIAENIEIGADKILYDESDNRVLLFEYNFPREINIVSVNVDNGEVSSFYANTLDNAFGENTLVKDVYGDNGLYFTVTVGSDDRTNRNLALKIFFLANNNAQPELLATVSESFSTSGSDSADFISTNKDNTLSFVYSSSGDIFEVNTLSNQLTRVFQSTDVKGPYSSGIRIRKNNMAFDLQTNRYLYSSDTPFSLMVIDRENLNSAIISR